MSFSLPSWSRSCLQLLSLALLGVVLIGCDKEPEPITAASSKYEVDDEPGKNASSATESQSSAKTEQSNARKSSELASSSSEPREAATSDSPSSTAEQPTNSQPPRSNKTSASPAPSSPKQGTANNGTPRKPPSIPSEQLDSTTIPDGPPDELWAFITELSQRPLGGRTDEERILEKRKQLGIIVTAAEKILENEQAPEELRQASVQVKLSALEELVSVGATEASAHIVEFCEALKKDKDPELSKVGRMFSFMFQVREFLDGRTKDPKPIIAGVERVLKEETKQNETFQFLRASGLEMIRRGHPEEGKQVVNMLIESFKSVEDPDIKDNLDALDEEALYLELDIPKKLDSFTNKEEGSLEALTEATRALLNGPNPGRTTLHFITLIQDRLERQEKVEAAKELNKDVAEVFGKSPDKELQELTKMAVESADRRLALLNQPLVLEGKLADGSELNWAEFQKDKVVLVIFWSVDNAEYIAVELPKIDQLREVYKNRGFDVIGVNVNRDKRNVERSLTFNPAPWPTILDGIAGNLKISEQCGVRMLPFTLLVGRDGKVSAMHVTSQTLPEKLPALLGATQGDIPADAAPGSKDGGAPGAPSDDKTSPDKSSQGSLNQPGSEDTAFVVFKTPVTGLDGEEDAEKDATKSDAKDSKATEEVNPYLAPSEFTRTQLGDFLSRMEDKPKSIRARPGFDDSLIDAANRILASDEKDALQLLAVETKFRTLQRQADAGVASADEQIASMLETYKSDERPAVRAEVSLLSLEREVLAVDKLPIEQVPALLDRLGKLFGEVPLTQRHLRIASATVHAINRLDVEKREEYFHKFGQLFAKSKDRELAVYGRKIAQTSADEIPDLVGKEMSLHGVTSLGLAFDWSTYRGKVVLVDFWATWCGPCMREAPLIKVLHDKYHDRGFDVVGVNLDTDREAVGAYLDAIDVPWTNLLGSESVELAKSYDIHGLPALFLVDQEGKVAAVARSAAGLEKKIDELLAKK